MKLLTYDPGTGPRCGVMQDDAVVDVAALIGAGQPLPDVRALLELGDSAVDRVGDALASNVTASPSNLRPGHHQSRSIKTVW